MERCLRIIALTALFFAGAQLHSVKKMVRRGGRVIGGHPADQNSFKFVVSIFVEEGGQWVLLGTGSILSKRVILTACHCITSEQTQIQADQQIISTDGSEKHPDCTSEKFFHHDVGVYFLSRELEFNNFVQPLKVISKDRQTAFEELNKLAINVATCFTAGYGVTDEGGTPSATLQQTSLTLVDNEICGDVLCDDPANYQGDETCYHQNAPWLNMLHEICAMDVSEEPKTTTCDGDSGAPLVCNGRVYGVLSRANCQPGSPSVFSDIYTVMYFVDKYAEKRS